MKFAAIALGLGASMAFSSAPQASLAALAAPQRAILTHYLEALQHERYDAAFGLLSSPERKYFGSAGNLASAYRADRLQIERFQILGSTTVPARGTLAVVLEHVTFFDFAHQTAGRLVANVRYGILSGPAGLAIKDPYHPWHAFAPRDVSTEKHGIRATVRKVSFFTGRVEIVVTFANVGRETVTLMPYGRTVLRDEAGASLVPLATKIAGLTDRTLFEGLRLVPSAEYTGALTFATVDRYAPHALTLTLAPALADGDESPFDLAIPSFDLPASQ